VPAPLPAQLLTTTAEAAQDDPALRVAIALAGVPRCCPARSGRSAWTRSTCLAAGSTPAVSTPLDEFTATAIRVYLAFRDRRWPATTSPYLLVTRKTAHTGDPSASLDELPVPRPARHRRPVPR
jgi:hypothetical protein